jgi:nucleotide-binding universal stress UspA family protein
MTEDARPVIVAFDGSRESEAAIRAAAELFSGHRLVVVSVWESGLAMAMAQVQDSSGVGMVAPTIEEIDMVDRAQHDIAVDVAAAGARLAGELGAHAVGYPVADEADVAHTLLKIAERCDAAAIAVGSRGLGAMKARLLGSVSHALLRDGSHPVLVVRSTE